VKLTSSCGLAALPMAGKLCDVLTSTEYPEAVANIVIAPSTGFKSPTPLSCTTVAVPPPLQEAVEQTAATKDALAGAAPSSNAALAAAAKPTTEVLNLIGVGSNLI
jgi:hypothetical protein